LVERKLPKLEVAGSTPVVRFSVSLRSVIAVLGVLAGVGLLVFGLASKGSSGLAVGDPVPTAPMPKLESEGSQSLADYRGRWVLVNFWASWCVPCREEAPALQRFWQAERAGGAVVLGLNMQDVTDDARAFVRQFGMTYPNVRDGGNGVARRYGTTGLPETFFISRRGRIVGHVIGVVSAGQLRDGLAAARAGRPLGVEQGGERRKTR
jgi:cytochrome c biogenesis protein CcmG, thiol:disulfide interchange protein DsbE